MIEYIKGDLLAGGDDVIFHGCNCKNTMGAGIALYISNVYPEAYIVDKHFTKYNDATKLGTYSKWAGQNKFFPEKEVTILNAYVQFGYSNTSKPFDYDAFGRVLPKIRDDYADKTIGTCKIGSGRAGGDWFRIEQMINDCFNEKQIKVYII